MDLNVENCSMGHEMEMKGGSQKRERPSVRQIFINHYRQPG